MKSINYCLFALVLASLLNSGCQTGEKENGSKNSEAIEKRSNASTAKNKVILFFGNSLTAGYGLESNESFPSLIQARLDSANYNYKVVNAGVSGETTATGKNRVSWVLAQQPLSIFVLELGANDGLRGIPAEETKKNLLAIIDSVKAKQPEAEIVLAGMMIPPNMGAKYSSDFQTIFPEVAKEKNVKLIPFLLQDVAAIDSLNLPDGIHPNASGQKLVARNVWAVLEPLLEKRKL